MKNNLSSSTDVLEKSWTVYKIICPVEDCTLRNPFYLGHTRNTIETRLRNHVQSGAVKEHVMSAHDFSALQFSHISDRASSLHVIHDFNRLKIYEALMILNERPDINRQQDNFRNPLKLYTHNITLPQNRAGVSTYNDLTPHEPSSNDSNFVSTIISSSQPITHRYNLRSRSRRDHSV